MSRRKTRVYISYITSNIIIDRILFYTIVGKRLESKVRMLYRDTEYSDMITYDSAYSYEINSIRQGYTLSNITPVVII